MQCPAIAGRSVSGGTARRNDGGRAFLRCPTASVIPLAAVAHATAGPSQAGVAGHFVQPIEVRSQPPADFLGRSPSRSGGSRGRCRAARPWPAVAEPCRPKLPSGAVGERRQRYCAPGAATSACRMAGGPGRREAGCPRFASPFRLPRFARFAPFRPTRFAPLPNCDPFTDLLSDSKQFVEQVILASEQRIDIRRP
jgi:hypothetical protein